MLPKGVWGQVDLGGIFLFAVVTIAMSCVATDHMQKNLPKFAVPYMPLDFFIELTLLLCSGQV